MQKWNLYDCPYIDNNKAQGANTISKLFDEGFLQGSKVCVLLGC